MRVIKKPKIFLKKLYFKVGGQKQTGYEQENLKALSGENNEESNTYLCELHRAVK